MLELDRHDGTTFVDCTKTIDEYISNKDWRIKANSNAGTLSNAGLVNQTAGKVIANYWLDQVYSSEEGAAHRNGDYHIHDLDCLCAYCAGWNLQKLLNEGFNGVRTRINSRPPKHLREALGQMANFLGILQSEWAGAQAFTSFDTYLAPFVFKDKLSFKAVKKAIRSFVYNLNVPSRWGQCPFTNITFDWSIASDLAENYPLCNNAHLFSGINDKELIDEAKKRGVDSLDEMSYKHFLPEMKVIQKAYYEVMTEGDSTGRPFSFPIPTINITENFDWNDPVVDTLFKNTAKMGNSYFQNFIGTQWQLDENGNKVSNPNAFKPQDLRSMCCRLSLRLNELRKRGNGLFGSGSETGSVGVVTINLPRLGYLYKGDKKGLFRALDKLMDLAKSSLVKKRAFVTKMFNRGLYPYTERYLPVGFKNHFSTIGINGANEMIRNFTRDKHNISDEYGLKLAEELLKHMNERLIKYQEETGDLFNLEASPGEGACHRFAREDKKRFPDIIQAGTETNNYYTNSTQLNVAHTEDPFVMLNHQNKLQPLYTGGTVAHLYMGEAISSVEACKKLMKNIMENYQLSYVTITPVFSICDKHGYISGNHKYCPYCDNELLQQHKHSCECDIESNRKE